MAGKPKYESPKKKASFTLTGYALENLKELAQSRGVSVSELIELVGREKQLPPLMKQSTGESSAA